MKQKIQAFNLLIEKLLRERESSVNELRKVNDSLLTNEVNEKEILKKQKEYEDKFFKSNSVAILQLSSNYNDLLRKDLIEVEKEKVKIKSEILRIQKNIYLIDKKIELITKKIKEFIANVDRKSQKRLDDEMALSFLLFNKRKEKEDF